ncbi:MAG: protein BatD [Chromatiaceae bacterium]|nr:protein BatD [Chromatiaceae bacterium]
MALMINSLSGGVPRAPAPGLRGWLRWLPLLLCLLVSVAGASGLQAELDRERLALNETLTLRLTASGDLAGEPDWSALSEDFEILNRSQSARMSIINGAISQSREWTLELAPRRLGILRIPALRLGQALSQPLSVEVVESEAVSAAERPVRLQVEVENPSPYVQEPFVYRVRVLYRGDLQRAVLSPPEAEGARILPHGEDRAASQMLDGEPYEAIERSYLVIPERSGPLTIEPPRLDAWLSDPSRGPDPFDALNQSFGAQLFQDFPQVPGRPGRRLIERAEPQQVEVRPQPQGYGPLWLPASSVQLVEEWNPHPPEFQVGEPVTRILTLTVKGLTAAQLPALDPGDLQGAQLYPEPPESRDLGGPGLPAAVQRLRLTLVPSRAGRLIIPEVRLPWWDTQSDQPQVAVIPARTVEVAPAAVAPPAPPPVAAPVGVAPSVSAPTPAPERASAPVEPAVTTSAGDSATPWRWLALAFGLGWLATLGLWWWRRQRQAPEAVRDPLPPRTPPPDARLATARACLESACAVADAGAARAALLEWGRARWPGRAPVGLAELGTRLADAEAAAQLAALDRLLYAPPEAAESARAGWDGEGFARVLLASLRAAESGAEAGRQGAERLPPLYPETPSTPGSQPAS